MGTGIHEQGPMVYWFSKLTEKYDACLSGNRRAPSASAQHSWSPMCGDPVFRENRPQVVRFDRTTGIRLTRSRRWDAATARPRYPGSPEHCRTGNPPYSSTVLRLAGFAGLRFNRTPVGPENLIGAGPSTEATPTVLRSSGIPAGVFCRNPVKLENGLPLKLFSGRGGTRCRRMTA